jgi:alkylation response protein AidB-like acyl-CoA dehydrogenase
MDFALSDPAKALQERLSAFLDERVLPAEAVYEEQVRASGDPHHHPAVVEELKAEARERGLWNLFLPHRTAWTDGLSNLDYAPLAELTGRSAIAAIKVAVPNMAGRVIDRAIQAHGAGGLCQNLPLAGFFAYQRVLRIADGPDEVHRRTVARVELSKATVPVAA